MRRESLLLSGRFATNETGHDAAGGHTRSWAHARSCHGTTRQSGRDGNPERVEDHGREAHFPLLSATDSLRMGNLNRE